jgi:hypothetical protein
LNNKHVDSVTIQKSQQLTNAEPDSCELAKHWLINSITKRYKPNGAEDTTVAMYTKQYIDYKGDAMSMEYDTVMTPEKLKKKWEGKYNTKFVRSNSFLIGQQDWVNPKITYCNLKSRTANKSFVFKLTIKDTDPEGQYLHQREIKVIPSANSFLIDDILEYND